MDLEHLFFNDVKIVHEPLRGGRDRAFLAGVLCDLLVGGRQKAPVVSDAVEDRAPPEAFPGDALRLREAFGVLFQPFDAEKFGPDEFRRLAGNGWKERSHVTTIPRQKSLS